MNKKTKVTVASGDGIGPEIMHSTLQILQEAGAEIDVEKINIGEKVYLEGEPTGMKSEAWESIKKTKVFLKAPITTPQGGGYRSLNVTIRTALGLYANIRPCVSYFPYIQTKHPKMDVVIIRENEEDLYTGIEYRPTPDVTQALKIISRPGCERIIRYAFEYARNYNRKKVTAFTKDNILKISDGLFHHIFNEIAQEYPDLENEHWIIDIGSAKIADTPENFDVVVMPNLYGDIVSDITAQITGSVGLVGTSNIGEHGAMFEAIHGSAPNIAGQNMANPTGLILAAVLMLVHIHQPEIATRVHNALLKTIEDGIHTRDIFRQDSSRQKVGTQQFTEAIVKRVGQAPQKLTPVNYKSRDKKEWTHFGTSLMTTKRELRGVDLFLYSHDAVTELVSKIQKFQTPTLELKGLTNRGVTVWPNSTADIVCVDQWRCRFESKMMIHFEDIVSLLMRMGQAGFDIVQTQSLFYYDGKKGYSSI